MAMCEMKAVFIPRRPSVRILTKSSHMDSGVTREVFVEIWALSNLYTTGFMQHFLKIPTQAHIWTWVLKKWGGYTFIVMKNVRPCAPRSLQNRLHICGRLQMCDPLRCVPLPDLESVGANSWLPHGCCLCRISVRTRKHHKSYLGPLVCVFSQFLLLDG